MMRKYAAAAIACATILVIATYATHGRLMVALAIAPIGLLWLILPWRGLDWVSDMGLAFFTAAAALGVLSGLSSAWLVPGMVALLVAWDLDHFARYLQDATDVRNKAGLSKAHLQRLGIVAGLGWLLGWGALGVHISFEFVWAFALGLTTILGLGGAIRYMRRESDG
jgi:hypothetical protein